MMGYGADVKTYRLLTVTDTYEVSNMGFSGDILNN